ncbi:DUF2171 domain-containing protein [Sphingomonas sp. MG17]|uniref:DUF2171 domain-containing protein n=1 Tax=Sphingomonas tagetis TaxID=2949092 RepID=A0A9X2HI77_9SPHN|nr:DUF2171 domain-containing protein [Sphingomonas tagetis]
MGYDRYPRNDRDDSWRQREDGEVGRDYGYSAEYGRSSARDYAVAGEFGRGRDPYRGRSDYYGVPTGREEGRFGNRNWDRGDDRGFGGGDRGLPNSRWDDPRRAAPSRGGYDRRPEGYSYQDRDFFSRAGDEVRSWFGDEEAERRREQDARYDARHGNQDRDRDDHYYGWRSRQISDLDRDYDEYRRENAARFENEFSNWRTERQGQRSSLSRVTEHQEVIGSDGQHVGTVDKVRGDRIVLTRSDADAGGHHHSIPSRWIESVDDNRVTIRKTADEAKAAWKDEERSGALFGEQGDRSGPHYLNRSFSGTY